MDNIKLSKRLEAIYNLISPQTGAADIGTDHGFIPVKLALSGFSFPIHATDINRGPLNSARSFAASHGVSEKISFHLCDGLSDLDGTDIHTIIIAGMGGEAIASILSAAPWTQEDNRLLILQPMSKSERLRLWLYENGYKILSENLVQDGPLYQLMTVSGGNDTPLSPAELLTGRFGQIKTDPLFPVRLNELTAKAEAAFTGLSSSKDHERLKTLPEYKRTLDSLLEMREKYKEENENAQG